jgi:hypothetical protein
MGWPSTSTVCAAEGRRNSRQRGFTAGKVQRLAGIFGVPARELTTRCTNCEGNPPAGLGTGQKVARLRECPYGGLLPFTESDAEINYGRERLAAELAVKLASRVASGGLVVVTGASGSGKSSLLRAGLLPILAKGQRVPMANQWPHIVMTPSRELSCVRLDEVRVIS